MTGRPSRAAAVTFPDLSSQVVRRQQEVDLGHGQAIISEEAVRSLARPTLVKREPLPPMPKPRQSSRPAIRSGNQARSTHHARAWLGREESREGSLANEGKQPAQDALISRRRISLERGEMAGPSVLAERGTEKSTPSTTGSRWWWSTSCSISPGTGGIAYLHDRPPLVPH